jgi:hypothetical protein
MQAIGVVAQTGQGSSTVQPVNPTHGVAAGKEPQARRQSELIGDVPQLRADQQLGCQELRAQKEHSGWSGSEAQYASMQSKASG